MATNYLLAFALTILFGGPYAPGQAGIRQHLNHFCNTVFICTY